MAATMTPPPIAPPPATRWAWCVVAGLGAVAAAVATAYLFLSVPVFRLVDQAAVLGAEQVPPEWEPWARRVLDVVSVPFLVVALIAAVAVALVRRQWSDAARAVIIVAGANLTSQVLKELLERTADAGVPGTGYGNSLPSGHSTVAASLAAVALLVAPRALRPLVALLGALYAAVTAVATMVVAWHRPSDLVAAFAIVSAWSLLVLIPTRGRVADGPSGTPGRLLGGALLAVIAVVGVAVGLVVFVGSLVTSGGQVSAASPVLAPEALRLAFLGAAAGVTGAAALASWSLFLARR